jgi:hypothetical protein
LSTCRARWAGETGRFVEEIWFARGRITGIRERIAPTGSTVAAVVLGDPILQTPVGQGTALLADMGFLIGPHDRPIVNEPQGETYCVGIVTTPVGCRPTLGLAPATLRGRIVDLPQAWPGAAGLRRELTSCRTPAEALDLIEAAVRTSEPSAAMRSPGARWPCGSCQRNPRARLVRLRRDSG